jgi:hypothetical protein
MVPYFVLSAIAFWSAALGGGFYFARRHVRALEQRTGNESELAELRERVIGLEDALDAMRREVERLDRAQELTTRLLAPGTDQGERAS